MERGLTALYQVGRGAVGRSWIPGPAQTSAHDVAIDGVSISHQVSWHVSHGNASVIAEHPILPLDAPLPRGERDSSALHDSQGEPWRWQSIDGLIIQLCAAAACRHTS